MQYFVGIRKLAIADDELNITFESFVFYPSQAKPTQQEFGFLSLQGSMDAPVAEGKYPLVVISHGTGGFNLGYLSIAQHLVENGFIVAMPEHYKNNRLDNSLENSDDNLRYRPKHIALTVKQISSDTALAEHIQPDAVAVIGHSMGGYSALAVAGGNPWNPSREQLEVYHLDTIKALVLLAPATVWFTPAGSLDNVSVPVLMLSAEHDAPFVAEGWHAQNANIVLSQLDEKQVSFSIVENSGHMSFMGPFPESKRDQGYPPAIDPDGFDRQRFLAQLNLEISDFLIKNLKQQN